MKFSSGLPVIVARRETPPQMLQKMPDLRAARRLFAPKRLVTMTSAVRWNCVVFAFVPHRRLARSCGVPAKPELIVFLCPNGHRLNGPASLEGKPGQCPHCGVKFRVPSRDDPIEDEEVEIPVEVQPELAGGDEGQGEAEAAEESTPFKFNFTPAEDRGSAPSQAISPPPSDVAVDRHPLADLFLKLWAEREKGSVLEIHLKDGSILVPERFSRELSRRKCGVFALHDPDGSYTVAAIDWQAVLRISLRHLSKPPKSMFE